MTKLRAIHGWVRPGCCSGPWHAALYPISGRGSWWRQRAVVTWTEVITRVAIWVVARPAKAEVQVRVSTSDTQMAFEVSKAEAPPPAKRSRVHAPALGHR